MSHDDFHGRLEDDRLVSGSGTYALDWVFPGAAHAVFLRSDHAHAEILSIDTATAMASPGVLAVLTGDDMRAAGLQSLPVIPVPLKPGETVQQPFRPCLAQDKVRFVGEPVACVIAESQHQAQDASEQIVVEYRDLPAIVVAADALAPDAPQLHEDVPGNLYFDFSEGDAAATDAAFARAARVVKHDLHNNRVIGNPMEPRCATGVHDPAGDHYTLYSPSQGPTLLALGVAKMMNVKSAQVDVVSRDVGGGFGIRSAVYPEYGVLLVAAKQLGRPVRWNGTRSEVFLADNQARDFTCHGELALDESGRFLAMRFAILANNGAYLAQTGLLAQTKSVTSCITGVYDVPAAHARIRLVATNTAQVSAYRGAGRPIMSTLLECLVERAAIELAIDPVALRRRNLIRKEQFPYRLVNGTTYDCGDFPALLDDALEAADWAGFEVRRAEAARRGRLLGHAVSTYLESTAAGGMEDEVRILFEADGSIVLRAPSHSQGQGHETSFAQVISRVLGIPMEQVKLRTGEPGARIQGSGTGGSRSMLGVGSVLHLGAQEVVEKGRLLAAQSLEAAAADIVFEAGDYRITGTDRRISLLSLAQQHAGATPHPLNTVTRNKFGSTFPNGAHIAEVEIDPETGVTDIVSYIAVDDIGNVISPTLVDGQMQGGLTQGAGQALGEEAVYDPSSGQLLTGSFMDYAMPRAVMVKGLKLLEHPVPTALNPLGAKGVGEAGCTGALPTLANAILDALRPAGVSHFDLPASPQRVWRALQEAAAGRPRAMQHPAQAA